MEDGREENTERQGDMEDGGKQKMVVQRGNPGASSENYRRQGAPHLAQCGLHIRFTALFKRSLAVKTWDDVGIL